MIELAGIYVLRDKFGNLDVPLALDMIEELTIVEDIKAFLPTLKLTFRDPTAVFTHLIPLDGNISSISIELGTRLSKEPDNSWDFRLFRRFPISERKTQSLYDITAIHREYKGLFGKSYTRGFNLSVKETLAKIAKEIGCNRFDISPSLDYKLNLVQPSITNAKFLRDLQKRITGKNGESCFYCFIKRVDGKSVFVFKTFEELAKSGVRKKYVVADTVYEDREPLFEFRIIDNYTLFNSLSGKRQDFAYFDWYKGRWIEDYVDYSNYPSLTDYLLIDKGDEIDNIEINKIGRTTQFNYKSMIKSDYYRRLNDLSKMWALVPGDAKIEAGSVVDVLFPESLLTGDLAYQYSGLWFVERVIHSVVDTHRTKLLLTRAGIDTIRNTSLIKANKIKYA